jgi:hypothetical protein
LIKHSAEQQHRLRQAELERFMNDSLDLLTKTVVNGRIVHSIMKETPLRWWRERGKHLYPTLATMAYNLFSIPSISSECERAFSASKRMITDERYNLKTDIIEADQCIKSWIKNGVADGQAVFNTLVMVDDEIIEILGP